jgi:quercetin dioxygenase-like cupin family protein
MVLGASALAEGSVGEGGSVVMRNLICVSTAALLAGCVTVNDQRTINADSTLVAIREARVRECPADRRQAYARSEGFGVSAGVSSEDIAFTPLASDPTRAMRLRRIVVQPGGVIPWHDHTAIQGMALLVSGEMVELRNTCLDPIIYRAGDVAIEDGNTAHSWRNESDEIAVVLVSHVVAR